MADNRKELKPGWRRVKFGDVVRQVKDKVDPETSGLGRYVAGDHMDTDDLRICRWGEIGSGYLGPAFHMRFKPGQVLYGSRRTYLRKVAVPNFEGVCANTTFVLETKDQSILRQELLPFVMQTEPFNQYSVKNSKGSVNPYINFSDLALFEFALPPIEEQHYLIEMISSADLAQATVNDARNYAEKLRKSLLLETFDALQAPMPTRIPHLGIEASCKWVNMAAAGNVLMGRQLSPKYKTGKNSRKYLRVANVFDGFIDTTDVNEMDFNDSEFETFKLKNGDVLLNEGQSRELVGRSAIFREEVEDCCFQNTLIRFRANSKVLPEFAHYYFQYCQYTWRFAQISKQTTSIAHLGVQRFAEMKFPLVDIEVQQAVVDAISAVVNAIPSLQRRASAAKTIKEKILAEEMGYEF